MADNVTFVRGTRAQYDLIAEKDANTLYWLDDEQALYKGEQLYGVGKEATQEAAGLLSAEDKKHIDELVKGSVLGLESTDGTIKIGDHDQGKTVDVKISQEADNALSVKEDGLYSGKVKVELEKKEEGAEGFAAVYRLKYTDGDSVTYSDVEINIPKDVFFKECTLKIAESDGAPYGDAKTGDPYLEVKLNDDTVSYVPLKGLIDTSIFVVRSEKTEKGEALISNDPTGGGAWYRRAEDDVESYVGVNDGAEVNGKPTPMAQIYAAKRKNGRAKTGSFLNVYEDKIIYNSKARVEAGAKNGDDEGEIAIRKDLDDLKKEADGKFVLQKVDGGSGEALVFNEADGGGVKFTRTGDGLKSFLGVHDGTAIGQTTGLAAQIYAVDGSGLGSRLNAFQDRITYIGKTAQEAGFQGDMNSADYELVVKKDLADLEKKLEALGGRITWGVIGQKTAAEMDETVRKIASETLGAYAEITVSDGTVDAQIKAEQGDVDINAGFGITLLTALKKSGLKSVMVKGQPDSTIDLAAGDFGNVANFVQKAGFTANKLKDLHGKTLALVFTDVGDATHEYTLNFTLQGNG